MNNLSIDSDENNFPASAGAVGEVNHESNELLWNELREKRESSSDGTFSKYYTPKTSLNTDDETASEMMYED